MRPALEFGQAPFGMVVAVGLHAAGVVERNPLVIAQRRTAGPLVGVFRDPVGPDACQIHLRMSRNHVRKAKKQTGTEVSFQQHPGAEFTTFENATRSRGRSCFYSMN